jgi:hypothetical protein
MHIGGFEHEFLLRQGRNAKVGRERGERADTETEHAAAIHDGPPELLMIALGGRTWLIEAAGPC